VENEISSYRAIKDWSSDDQPREKLAKYGSNSLSNSELLAILIGFGSKGFSAVDTAKDLLTRAGTLPELIGFSIEQIKRTKGLGDAKAIGLVAAFELAKRIKANNFSEMPLLNSPDALASMYMPRFYGVKQEQFLVILLNTAKRLIRDKMITQGLIDGTLIHSREIFKFAIENSASSIILMHNHPSGNKTPSNEDIRITKQLVEGGNLLDIPVLDHLIIAGDEFTSLRLEGLM